MLSKFLQYVYRLTRNNAYWVLAVILALSIATLIYTSDIPIERSLLDLLPRNDKLLNEYQQWQKRIGNTQVTTIVLTLKNPDQVPKSRRAEKLLAVARVVKNQILNIAQIHSVNYRKQSDIPEEFTLLYAVNQNQLEEIKNYQQHISDFKKNLGPLTEQQVDLAKYYRQFHNRLEQLESTTTSDQAASGSTLQQEFNKFMELNQGINNGMEALPQLNEANNVVKHLTEQLKQAQQRLEDPATTAFFSPNKTMLLVNARPIHPSTRSVHYSALVTHQTRDVLQQIENREIATGVNLQITGPYAFTTQTDHLLRMDMLMTSIISCICVMVVFFFAFGSVLYSLMVVIPLAIAVLLTIGWAKFSVGGFNLITTFIPALVLGLGIDYGIHLLVRFTEERSLVRTVSTALRKTLLSKGKGSLMAALTTAAVFTSLLLARSQGFVTMGIISSVGILISFLMYIFMLPSLLMIHERWRGHGYQLDVFDYHQPLKKFVNWVTDHRKWVIGITLVVISFSAYQATQLEFQFSSNELSPKVKSSEVAEKVQKSFASTSMSMGPTFTFLPQSEKELLSFTQKLQKHELVEEMDSIIQYLPENLEQKSKVLNNFTSFDELLLALNNLESNLNNKQNIINQLNKGITGLSSLQFSATVSSQSGITDLINKILDQLITVKTKLADLNAQQSLSLIKSLENNLKKLQSLTGKLTKIPNKVEGIQNMAQLLPETIRSRFVTSNGRYILYAHLDGAIYESNHLNQFVHFADSFANEFFGTPLVQYRLEHYMKRDFWVATIFAVLIISLILWLGIGSFKLGFMAALPLILGYAAMLGGMETFGMNFNFINITISPLLIGIGIDNGIHLIHRWQESEIGEQKPTVSESFSRTGLAIITSSLTTLSVFGSFLIAQTPGLRVMGFTALMGVGFTLIFSMTTLPAALTFAFRDNE